MNDASTLALKRELTCSPCLFPMDQSPDGKIVHFIRLSEEDYRRASFLDQRMLREAEGSGRGFHSGNVPWELFYPWTQELPVRCNFIFHISHAGSTMLARMLGEHPDCLALREPWILRSLIHPLSQDRMRAYLSLWSRTFRPNQRALIKATSFVSQIGGEMLRVDTDSKALLMYVPAETFLASVLDGSMSDIDSCAASRMARLPSQGVASSFSLADMGAGERAAMSWLVEMGTLRALNRSLPNRTRLVDFDSFLKDVRNQLCDIAQWLDWQGHEDRMLDTSLTTRYAKKPDVSYDSNFRERLLAQSRSKHQGEIWAGLRWIERAMREVNQ